MSTRAQRLRDKVLSGAYDWIIFPAALTFVALIAFGLWKDYSPRGSRMERLVMCEQAADSKGSNKEHLISCLLEVVDSRAPNE